MVRITKEIHVQVGTFDRQMGVVIELEDGAFSFLPTRTRLSDIVADLRVRVRCSR
jgi:hypothetical protein